VILLGSARSSNPAQRFVKGPAVAKVKMAIVAIFRKDITVFPYPSIPTYLGS
jgi:hypothetical protein